jgi:hypothetical protein
VSLNEEVDMTLVVARFLSDGTLDPDFADAGIARTALGGREDLVAGIEINRKTA